MDCTDAALLREFAFRLRKYIRISLTEAVILENASRGNDEEIESATNTSSDLRSMRRQQLGWLEAKVDDASEACRQVGESPEPISEALSSIDFSMGYSPGRSPEVLCQALARLETAAARHDANTCVEFVGGSEACPPSSKGLIDTVNDPRENSDEFSESLGLILDRGVWFENVDTRDCQIRSWPQEFIDFLRDEIEWGVSRNPETLSENIWVLSNSLRGTFFIPRLREFVSICNAAKREAKSLKPSDFKPPILPHDLYSAREAEEERWELCRRFGVAFLACVEGNVTLPDVRKHIEPFVELSPGSFECDLVSNEIHGLLDWTLADVAIGTPLGAGEAHDESKCDQSRSERGAESLKLDSVVRGGLSETLEVYRSLPASKQAAVDILDAIEKDPRLLSRSHKVWASVLQRSPNTIGAAMEEVEKHEIYKAALGSQVSSDTGKKNLVRRKT